MEAELLMWAHSEHIRYVYVVQWAK